MKLKIFTFFIVNTFLFSVVSSFSLFAQNSTVQLKWLGASSAVSTGISWGVPFKEGEVQPNKNFILKNIMGEQKPVQSYPLAYWPDGSMKWIGFCTTASTKDGDVFNLEMSDKTNNFEIENKLSIDDNSDYIKINTGVMCCDISKRGVSLIKEIKIGDRVVAENGKLICTTEDKTKFKSEHIVKYADFESNIENVTIEKDGPVKAVVKIEGKHKALKGKREWLPFCVRLYFYAGVEKIKMVHTFIFDGDEHNDFISNLGLTFSVPLKEELQNRTVRFGGEDDGLWSEPVKPLVGRGGRYISFPGTNNDVYSTQIQGQRVPNRDELTPRGQNFLDKWASWSDFRLNQLSADGFTVEKRTNSSSSWIPAGSGKRAGGLVFVGDISGGLAVGLKDFWQSYPASLEVENATSSVAEMKIWLWSPYAEPMDLRHYDTIAHGLNEVYEDVQPGFSTPVGVARTHEITLFPSANIPTKLITSNEMLESQKPPLLVCNPQYLHSKKAFGIWSLQDRSTPFKKAIEDRLDRSIAFYQKAIEQNSWYGFWDYGDVMHSYDNVRHVWRYDLGGMAWDNSELGTDMWLWYSFLRTGREDIFWMAEAMTRHTGEVDVYHLGKFAGLGSRHNVRHWGGGAKEARISQAAFRRFMYYLTTDERVGDIMHEVADVDYKTAVEFDAMRLASPKTAEQEKYQGRVRLGPDWFALVSNWATEWERTGDTIYRNKIYAGMDCIAQMPMGIRSGKNILYGYDPETSKLYQLSDEAGDHNLATIQGGAEIIFELNEYVGHAGWLDKWLQYCRLTRAPKEVLLKDNKTKKEGSDGSFSRGDRLSAYVYYKTKNVNFAKLAIDNISRMGRVSYETKHIAGSDVMSPIDECPYVSTNSAAQSGLMAIEVLEMCKDQLPIMMPEFSDFSDFPGRKGRKINSEK